MECMQKYGCEVCGEEHFGDFGRQVIADLDEWLGQYLVPSAVLMIEGWFPGSFDPETVDGAERWEAQMRPSADVPEPTENQTTAVLDASFNRLDSVLHDHGLAAVWVDGFSVFRIGDCAVGTEHPCA